MGTLLAQNLDASREAVEAWTKRGDRKTETRALMLGWAIEQNGDSVLFSSARDDTLNYIEVLRR